MMNICDEKEIVLHDFAEMVERMPLLKLDLDKKNLSAEYAQLQKHDKI